MAMDSRFALRVERHDFDRRPVACAAGPAGWVSLARLQARLVTRLQDHPVLDGMALRRRDAADAAMAVRDVVPVHNVAPPLAGVFKGGEAARGKQRDPEMHQTKKGNPWYFGMKVHVSADVNSGLVHSVSVTPANVSDINQLPHLAREAGLFWGVSFKASKQHPLTEANKRFNHRMSSIRARRARFSRHQAPVRLNEGALQGDREERSTGVLSDRFDQSLFCGARIGELTGEIRPLRPKTGALGRKRFEKQR